MIIALRCPNWTTTYDPQPHSGFVIELEPFSFDQLVVLTKMVDICDRCGSRVVDFVFVDPDTMNDSDYESSFRGKAGR